MGCLLAQLSKGPVIEVVVEYAGDFHPFDLSPVRTAVIKGLLTPMVKDTVNSVNAEVMARERGIKVTETTLAETEEYLNLITVSAVTEEGSSKVAGTIFGRKDPRVVNINNFRLELHPHDRFVLIHNHDKPGAIGAIGMLLAEHGININKMRVGQEEGGDKTMIFIRTDPEVPEEVLEKLRKLPLNITVTAFEL
jgi:D-3-phosphoglycerate dehydrogenase